MPALAFVDTPIDTFSSIFTPSSVSTAVVDGSCHWSPSLSSSLYRIDGWGAPYFAANSSGNISVRPHGSNTLPHQDIDLMKVVKKVTDPSGLGLHLPLIVRFPDVLKNRLECLQSAFDYAIQSQGYDSHYQGVYPVKCNQDRFIIEDIVEFGSGFRFGLEAGSKPEILLAMSCLCKGNPEAFLVCNGFKDSEYISLALFGRKLELNTVIVLEQEEELDLVIDLSQKMNVRPVIGLRAKLRTKHSGHFGSTSGEKGKFGLTTVQILRVVRKLSQVGMLDCLQLLHFHIGSQIPSTALLSDGVAEAAQLYCELVRLGAHMKVIDIGGGLGIDFNICFLKRFCFIRKKGEEMKKHVMLVKPFSLEDEKDSENTPPNLIQRILSLFKNVRPGSDLTNFQLPPQMNLARSQLQCYGEIVYSFDGHDLLGECSRRDKPIERMKAMVTWYISTLRPLIFGLAPYNPVIGETHHVSNGHINVLAEQISHHPPVSALHATHEKENVDVLLCQYFTPKFRGAYVDVEVKGKRVVKLLNHKETYEMNQPKLLMTFLPAMGAHWAGKIVIKCPETGLGAELQLLSDSFLSRFTGNNKRAIKGKIFESSSRKQLYEISGHWDRTVTAKNTKTGQLEVIYKASENIAKLKTPIVENLQEVSESESAVVWGEVSEGIVTNNWEKAREAKRDVEEKQRESLRKRKASGQSWIPKHFSVARTGKDWDCVPLQPTVPRAPIVVPL